MNFSERAKYRDAFSILRNISVPLRDQFLCSYVGKRCLRYKTKWDDTEDLCTKEDARLYIEACTKDDPEDGNLIRAALSDIARANQHDAATP